MLKSRSLPRQRSIKQDKTNSRFSPRLPLFGGAFFCATPGQRIEQGAQGRKATKAARQPRPQARSQGKQGRKLNT